MIDFTEEFLKVIQKKIRLKTKELPAYYGKAAIPPAFRQSGILSMPAASTGISRALQPMPVLRKSTVCCVRRSGLFQPEKEAEENTVSLIRQSGNGTSAVLFPAGTGT